MCRYQEEEREKALAQERCEREVEQKRRREKLEEEASRRDQLMRNVQVLEQRRLELQRELKLRNLSSSAGEGGAQLKSAIVVPNNETKI